MQHLVFVYGTLRHGESNHTYLQHSQLLGQFETKPEYALYDLGAYPGLVEGHQSVHGEVYLVDEHTLAQLDIWKMCQWNIGVTRLRHRLVPRGSIFIKRPIAYIR